MMATHSFFRLSISPPVMITCFIVISCINYHYSSRLFSKSKDPVDKNDIKPGIVMSDEVIKGWPPDGNLNISGYIKPDIDTTLIEPTLPLRTNISWRSDIYSKVVYIRLTFMMPQYIKSCYFKSL